MSLSSQGIEYDVTDIKKHSDEFIEKFNELKNINDSNKISIWSNKIYLDGSVFGTQWFMRKFTGQGRNTVKDYFEQQFSDYIKLLEMMIAAERTIRYIDDRYKELLNIMNDNKEFINTIKSGLDHTKNMYKDDNKLNMSDTIDNIISKLDSYINQYDKLKKLYDNRLIDSVIPKGFTISDTGSDPGSPIINPFSCMPYGIAPRLFMMNRERSQSED
tara:strand:+ start:60 stop:707 length:648 start_codon:yes stop_codon:yes gene_type:complete